jgi:hypothetical protein
MVPMLKESRLIGAIAVYRQEVRPFTDKQIELVANFAAQAVIAIENTRLLSELRQRTDDLTESLDQQTATSEVLRVISSSPSELDPVFQVMLANAMHLCEANFGIAPVRRHNNGPYQKARVCGRQVMGANAAATTAAEPAPRSTRRSSMNMSVLLCLTRLVTQK